MRSLGSEHRSIVLVTASVKDGRDSNSFYESSYVLFLSRPPALTIRKFLSVDASVYVCGILLISGQLLSRFL